MPSEIVFEVFEVELQQITNEQKTERSADPFLDAHELEKRRLSFLPFFVQQIGENSS